MSSATSASEHARLHLGVQRWLNAQGWSSLRPAQAAAVGPVLAEGPDVIITAPTAGGKTEAAFLPICSRLAPARDDGSGPAGVEVLYVSPLKALINDQYDRLGLLCRDLGIPVHRWHGDVSASAKARIRRSPAGIVVITPESLEALFVTAGPDVARILGGLRYVVVDELHAFLGTERGMQLQSLLHRAEEVLGRRVPRIALSATLASPEAAQQFLRPGAGEQVHYIDTGQRGDVRLRVFGHQRRNPTTTGTEDEPSDLIAISERLFTGMRGRDHLVFANRRSDVESFADRLSRLSEEYRVPNEFFAHHGNLAKEEREFVEQRLKSDGVPTTAVCTSTLEMGVDIGSVDAVAQIGPPPGVASLRQRMGRSGRRGGVPQLMVHVSEDEISEQITPLDELRPRLVQTIAMIQLMGDRYLEKPDPAHPHLSTLIQQVLAVIAQRGGASASALFRILCERGPFRQVDQPMFADLLRAMGAADLLQQGSDGLLLAGRTGDRMINHYSFYTAFHTPEELRIVHGSRTLGTVAADHTIRVDGLLLFGGRRWRVIEVEIDKKIVMVTPSSGARPPRFEGSGGPLVADEVRRRMRRIYLSDDEPGWIDAEAAGLLREGRAAFARLDLAHTGFVSRGNETLVVPWRGDKIMNTLAVLLQTHGLAVAQDGTALTVDGVSAAQLQDLLARTADSPAPDALELAAEVPGLELDKHDRHLPRELLVHSYAARFLDVPNTWQAVRDLKTTIDTTAPPTPGAPSGIRATLGTTPFAVVDVETTGFDADGADRIVEVAVVRLAPDGSVHDSWSTLVDPGRSAGPTAVHGLTSTDLTGAPTFDDIADDLLAKLGDAIVVAHNADFDRRFLHAELKRAGRPAPQWPILCTRRLAYRLASATGRRLTDLCRTEGLHHEGAHSALADADAAGRLLTVYLKRADAGGITTAPELGVSPLVLPTVPAPPTSPAEVHLRSTTPPERRVLAGDASGDPRLDAYLDLLEIVLADHIITADEERRLTDLALATGLTRAQVAACRHAATIARTE